MTHGPAARPNESGCNPPQETVGRLRRWSDARSLLGGISIREFSDLTGINRGQLSKIEHGQAPTPDEARRILFIVDGFGR